MVVSFPDAAGAARTARILALEAVFPLRSA